MKSNSRRNFGKTFAISAVALFAVLVVHHLIYLDFFKSHSSEPIAGITACRPSALKTTNRAVSQTSPSIPNTIHQIWKTNNVSTYPTETSHRAWKAFFEPLHYTVKLWTDDDILQLIRDKYSWLLSTYEAYPHNIQRADVARLVVIHAEGGVYSDLDVHPGSIEGIGCLQNLGFQAVFAPNSGAEGFSNHFFMAQRESPVLQLLLDEAKQRKQSGSRRFLLPYLEVFWSTGPMMVTSVLRKHVLTTEAGRHEVGVLDEESVRELILHTTGRSWHGADGRFLNWMSDNARLDSPWMALPLLSIIVLLVHLALRRRRYTRLSDDDFFTKA
ncbi:hypothetical protein HIM_00847 [Hirsutella minnesotensis 3608]|nr:hypothetical protein HIM_00847 [Hirsutella minnesotensis 3608]